MKRFRPGTAVLVVLILVLGYFLALGQRREARLRAALAFYEGRANGAIARYMDHGVGPSTWTRLAQGDHARRRRSIGSSYSPQC